MSSGIILGAGKAENILNDVSPCVQNTLHSLKLSLTLRLVWEGDSELTPRRQTLGSNLGSASSCQATLDEAHVPSKPLLLFFVYKVRVPAPILRAAGKMK